ncbi:MAG: hypothetical protein WA691_06115 [Thermoplasmata archaeon]
MQSVYGFPLSVVLILAGMIVLIGAWLLHWLLLIAGVALIVLGVYFYLSGGAGPI